MLFLDSELFDIFSIKRVAIGTPNSSATDSTSSSDVPRFPDSIWARKGAVIRSEERRVGKEC